ncbi:MAG: hypothetical protein LBV34_11355, partial [Nocardiopsaceae bacterium]|nr:hypothetical protein [Nocardiopsaceae bacterium]
ALAELGVVLLAAGNAPLITLGGVVTRPVSGISPSRFALAWRADDRRPLVPEYARVGERATRPTDCRGTQSRETLGALNGRKKPKSPVVRPAS